MPRPSPALALLTLLAACAAPVTAPPLEKRPAEREAVPPPDAEREPAVPADAALTARLDDLRRRAEAAHARFDEERTGAARLVRAAAGAAAGSEPWLAAQQAVSALDTARGPLRRIVDELERLRDDPTHAGSGVRAAVDAAADRLDDLDRREAEAVSALSAALR